MLCVEWFAQNASKRAAAVSYVTKQVLLWLQANFFNATAAFSSCTRCLCYFDVLIMFGKVGKVLILHRNRWHLHMIFPSYINKGQLHTARNLVITMWTQRTMNKLLCKLNRGVTTLPSLQARMRRRLLTFSATVQMPRGRNSRSSTRASMEWLACCLWQGTTASILPEISLYVPG